MKGDDTHTDNVLAMRLRAQRRFMCKSKNRKNVDFSQSRIQSDL
jgi:hypothetical protein